MYALPLFLVWQALPQPVLRPEQVKSALPSQSQPPFCPAEHVYGNFLQLT